MKTVKKILHILCQKPGHTGSGIYLRSIVDLARAGNYEQAVIAGVSRKDEGSFENIEDRVETHPVYFDSEELPFPVVGMSDEMPYPSTRYRELTPEMYVLWKKAFTGVIDQVVSTFKPDIIISHHLWLLTALVKKIAPDIPVIAVCHGTGLRQMMLAEKFVPEVIVGCQKVDLVLALNKYQKESIVNKFKIAPEKVQIIGNGFFSNIFYFPENKNNDGIIRLIYAGKLSKAKGISSLLRVYRALSRDHSLKTELHLVGSCPGADKKLLQDIENASPDKVIYHGAVAQKQLGLLFQQSDIFILPSFYEGLPLVLIEALASGLRVVTTDLPGVRDFLGEAINSSGAINYVPLPRLKNADVPFEEDLPYFEDQIKSAIKKQAHTIGDFNPWENQGYREALAEMSWERVFQKIEKFFEVIKKE